MLQYGAIKPWQIYGQEHGIGRNAAYSQSDLMNRQISASFSDRLAVYDPSGSAVEVSLREGNKAYIVFDQGCTITIQKTAKMDYQEIVLLIDPSTFSVTWGDTITWIGGTPSLTASTLNILKLWTIDSWGVIFGESISLGVSYSRPTIGKAVLSHCVSPNADRPSVHSFNMITETIYVGIDNGFQNTATPSDEYPLSYAYAGTALNFSGLGFAVIYKSDSSAKTLNYATNAVCWMASYPPESLSSNVYCGAVDWDDDYREGMFMLGFYKTYSFYSYTMVKSVLTVHDGTASGQFRTSAVWSQQYEMKVAGSDYTATYYDYATRFNYSTHNYTQQTMPADKHSCAAWGHDIDTGIAYMLGGDAGSGAVNTIFKHVDSTNTFSTVAGTLPVAVKSNKGMAQDGAYIWGWRTDNAFKFTVSSETAASGTTASVENQFAAFIHGETMPI